LFRDRLQLIRGFTIVPTALAGRRRFRNGCSLACAQRERLLIFFRSILVLAISISGLSGCHKEVADTRIQDEDAIRAADAATLRTAKAGDVDGAIANYAEGASWLPPNSPMIHGKAAIREGWAKLIGSPGFNIDWQINKLEIARSGDLAYTIYVYQLAFEGPDGQPITDRGKDMAVWKKQSNNTWKMVADTFNSDLPLAVPANSSKIIHHATKHRPSKRRRSPKN
jgi:ketosteroid isomerase-like protein